MVYIEEKSINSLGNFFIKIRADYILYTFTIYQEVDGFIYLTINVHNTLSYRMQFRDKLHKQEILNTLCYIWEKF